MKKTFAELWDIIREEEHQSLQQDDYTSKASTVYSKQPPEFWDSLSDLSNHDPHGLGELLGVDAEIIATWYSKIKSAQEQNERATSEKKKTEMLPTGN